MGNQSLAERRACLIVGASGTIGSAVARKIAFSNTAVGLHYRRNRDTAEALRKELAASGIQCHCFQSGLESEDACARLMTDFHSHFGVIDALAICHGEVTWRDWQELAWPDWSEMFQQHCLAPYALVKQAIHYMIENGGGRIVYLSSISPKYAGSPRSIHYAAAKGALEVMMRGLAREVARSGICINGVRAGFLLTPQQTAGRSQKEIEERIRKIPVGRAGKPEEVAAAFQYLMSDAAGYITGEIITVAGGD